MSSELTTTRLRLISLSAVQLKEYLIDRHSLGEELGFPLSTDALDDNVIRAINTKLEKMAKVDVNKHDWHTYWLIIMKAVPFGAGLIGFKGYPDTTGKTEVGYGIDAAYRNEGYTTEALKALSDWAFSHPYCGVLTATTVINPASEKVLQKAGWRKVRQQNGSSDWELHKK